jgi:hypothetical protein
LKNLLCTSTSAPLSNHVRALILTLICSAPLLAQDLTTPLISDSWQSTFSNPALYGQLRGRLTIGLPGGSNDLAIENATYSDLLSVENGQRILDLTRLTTLLEDRNEIRDDFTVETIGVGLRGDRFSVGLYHRLRGSIEADLPKTLIQIIAEGNAQFIGQTIEIAPLGAITSFHELAFGASYAITDKIHFGARIKYLSGIADLRSELNGSLKLTTGEENFALTLDQDYTVNSAGALEYEGIGDVNINYDLRRLRTDQLFSGNNGIAFDFGLFADLGKLRLQAAANDIGGTITWENEVTNLDFTGTDAFTGLDILEQLLEDSISFAGAVDSIQIEFDPTETNNSYKSDVSATYLIGAEFDVTDRLTAGLLIAHYARPQTAETAFAISARYRVIEQLAVGFNYNARRNASANLGVHLYANVGPVQLLASTDNLLTVFRQKKSSRAGVRLGAALAFGQNKVAKKAAKKAKAPKKKKE